MKLWWFFMTLALALTMMVSFTNAESDLWEEDDDKEVLVRTARGARASGGGDNSPQCRYSKGPWSDCDPKSNMKTRTLNLKKGDGTCEKTKLITKKCKKGKACRYDKGTWSSCVNQEMIRKDNLKPNSDPSCEKTRSMKKKCKPEVANKKGTKDRSNKKVNKQQQ